MELIDGFYVDSNNNKWDAQKFSESSAKQESELLVNCKGCIDCRECSDCENCVNCEYCKKCVRCRDCCHCMECNNCKGSSTYDSFHD